MRGLTKKIYSNRDLAKRFKNLNRISFCKYHEKFIARISSLKKMPFDTHELFPTDENYVYRSVINENLLPFNTISRIKFNPNPKSISRANIRGQGIGYYTCAPDISIIEGCRDKLISSSQRKFYLTVSKWKIKKKLILQIVCNSIKAQASGTDLADYCLATRKKRRKELGRVKYRTYFLKTKFLSDQYAKENILCEKDYFISAIHSNTVFKSREIQIDGIIYPSVQYLFKGFNYAFKPSLFENSYFDLEEVAHVMVEFDNKNISKYPKWDVLESTCKFDNDNIIWGKAII